MKRSLKNISLVVSVGTLISKLGGMIRQLVIAGAFGIGATYDAYNYAYVIPGFFLILLGGLNGPFHNAIVSVLSQVKNKRDSAHILTSVIWITSFLLILISTTLIIFANPIIRIIGPSLSPEIHMIAVQQLKIMAPITFISGLIGLFFGALNANNQFFLPAVAPIFSSISIIIFSGYFWLEKQGLDLSDNIFLRGGILIAVGTVIGSILQLLIQVPSIKNKNLIKLAFIWDFKHSGVKKVLKIMAPATFSSGMLQINVLTDLFFASNIIGAASGLSYANFLIQAPLGLLSNALLIPLLPTLSKLASENDNTNLIKRIHQALILSSASMIGLGTIFVTFNSQIVSLIYERGAFDGNAVKLVSSLLIAYGIGMPVYLGRDLIVRIFYCLGDAKTPFRFSSIGIFINIILDWIAIGAPSPLGDLSPINLGAAGIVFATVGVNAITYIYLLIRLKSKIKGLKMKELFIDKIKLLFSGFISGTLAFAIQSLVIWPSSFLGLFGQVIISIIISLILFISIGILFRVKEIKDLIIIVSKKFILH